jgi:hypothetical protein
MAPGLLIAIAGTDSGLFVIKFIFFNWVLSNQRAWMWACELTAHGPGLARSHYRYRQWFFSGNFFSVTWVLRWPSASLWACKLIADGLGLAHSHSRYRHWFFASKFIFLSIEFWAIKMLDCKHVCSQLMALGLLTATIVYQQWFFTCYYFSFQLIAELSMSLIVSMWAHSSWPWACSQPLPCIGNGLFIVNCIFFTWILRWLSACLWACELTANGPGLAHSHCRYQQWSFRC